jgi:hypothetical protein
MGHQNFFATRLYADIGTSDTTISLEQAPVETSGRLVLEARNPTQREIIEYTGVSGNTVTGVVRGAGGTTAKTHTKTALVEMNLTAEDIKDLYDAFDSFAASTNDWRTLIPAVSSVVYLGQRSYEITFVSTVAALLSPGMRLRTTRTVAAPTQCTDLESSSSQYWNKTTPAGMTWTDDFVTGAWIKLESYGALNQGVITRFNGTSGWELRIENNAGRVMLIGYNGGVGNFSLVQTQQSIPLGRWVHIAAQLDMSAFTATPTTSYIMLDGVDVPCTVARAGTNPTALLQAGNLEVGSTIGATYFDGKIAQAFVSSAKITQANVRTIISQGLTSALITTHSIASAYAFNGNGNDLNTTNANNLTAQNGATALSADSPFGVQADDSISSTLDHLLVTRVNGAVVTVQAPEGSTVPTSGGVSAVSYSSADTPFGFPKEKSRWEIQSLMRVIAAQTAPVSATWYNPASYRLSVPVGAWVLGYDTQMYGDRASGDVNMASTLSTTNNSEFSRRYTVRADNTTPVTQGSGYVSIEDHEKLTAETIFYLNIVAMTTGLNNIYILGDRSRTLIKALPSYL